MNNRILLSVALAASCLASCGGGGGGGGGIGPIGVGMPSVPAEPAPPPKDCTVYLAGDSILAGENKSGFLARRPADVIRAGGFVVTDASKAGDSATLAIGKFENTQLTQRFVVIEWFTNDVNAGFDVIPPLARAIQHVKSSGRVPVMTGAYARAGTDKQRAAVADLAATSGVVSAGWDTIQGAPFSDTDGHPSQEYSDALATAIVGVLQKLAPECK